MANMTNYLEEKLLEHTLLNLPWSSPNTVYLALLTDNPSESDLEAGELGNEVDGGNYERQSIDFSGVVDSEVENEFDIEFPQATDEWGEVTHVYIMDSETGGNALYWQELNIAKTIREDDLFKVPANNLTVEHD
ncbi:hypothetical protein MWH25_01460 [Natroniella acetigena]|uniref:phage tail fiber protein n=1 Tax=Natroniella acetigena TaxID=52004 RepID=UPI00200AE968|nr:hypothetical protein [Natroniella acetigena]MCK8826415.1 hypothetical protein [Natroniella acetigena]